MMEISCVSIRNRIFIQNFLEEQNTESQICRAELEMVIKFPEELIGEVECQ